MIIKTERLILRPWRESDAESLYEYAKNPEVGPIAGWPVHTSVENSREIIRNVLMKEYTYAVTRKEDDKAIGSISLLSGVDSNIDMSQNEVELGYWIGRPFWGNGYIPEAARSLIRFAFTEFGAKKVWSGYFAGNEKSKRVQEKCGFIAHHIEKDMEWKLMNDIRTEYITCLTFEEWLKATFLADTTYVDYSASNIAKKAEELFSDDMTELQKIETAFLFVRDEIPHSFDCNASVVTAKASEVLKEKTGICHAKANLLAALLRSQGIPAGFRYQHLTLADDDSMGYCLHCYNVVYLQEGKWIEIDARGNKEGVDAQFVPDGRKLAFMPREEYDEFFIDGMFDEPDMATMLRLDQAESMEDIVHGLQERCVR